MKQKATTGVTIIVAIQVALLIVAIARNGSPVDAFSNPDRTSIDSSDPETSDSAVQIDPDFTPPDGLEFPLYLEEYDPIAKEIALAWNPEAQLVAANMQLDWPQTPSDQWSDEMPRGGWFLLTYVAGSEMLSLRIDRGSGELKESNVISITAEQASTYLSMIIDYSQASTTSETVAIAGEAAYGRAFRAQCPENRPQSWYTVARSGVTGGMIWRIDYVNRRPDLPQDLMSIDVDWASGELENIQNLELPCG